MVVADGPKILRFLFLSIRRLHLIYILPEIYIEKVLQELFWAHFLGRPYSSSCTKIHLDAALAVIVHLKHKYNAPLFWA